MALQKYLIQFILAPLAKLKTRLPEKFWSVMVALSSLGIILMQFAISAGLVKRYMLGFLPFCLFLGIIILAGLTKEMKPVAFSPAMLICWFGLALAILATGVLVNHDCLGEAMLWLAAYPVLYLVWCNRPFKELAKPVIDSVYLSFLVMVLLLMWKSPIEGINFKGFFVNSNGLAMYCTAVFVTVLADLMSQERFSARVVLMDIVAGMAVSVSYCTNSRACQYVMIAVSACAGILFLVMRRKQLLKAVLCFVLPLVLAIVLLFSNSVTFINSGAKMIAKVEKQLTKPTVVQNNNNTNTNNETAVAPAEKEDPFEAIRERNELRQTQGDTGDFTTGRTELWGIYLAAVKPLGNAAEHTLYYANGKEVIKSAHNTLIQMAYEYGGIAALFFLALNLLSGIRAAIYAIKNRGLDYSAFPVMIALCYGGYYLVEKILYPSQCLMLLLYLLSQVAVFAGRRKKAIAEKAE